MLEYLPTTRDVGLSVYSSGFHTSDDGTWIPAGEVGRVVQSKPCKVDFKTKQGVFTLRSDISNTERGAFALAASDRTSRRWRI